MQNLTHKNEFDILNETEPCTQDTFPYVTVFNMETSFDIEAEGNLEVVAC